MQVSYQMAGNESPEQWKNVGVWLKPVSVIQACLFFFKQKTAYEIGLGIPAEPLFRSDVLPRTPGNNVYVGFMVWSNFTATKCRGLVSLNQVIKEIICLQPLK